MDFKTRRAETAPHYNEPWPLLQPLLANSHLQLKIFMLKMLFNDCIQNASHRKFNTERHSIFWFLFPTMSYLPFNSYHRKNANK